MKTVQDELMSFPFEFHHIDHTHPRYVMSYHWHVEYEIIRILEGSLTVTLDEKSFTAAKDVIFVHSGIPSQWNSP